MVCVSICPYTSIRENSRSRTFFREILPNRVLSRFYPAKLVNDEPSFFRTNVRFLTGSAAGFLPDRKPGRPAARKHRKKKTRIGGDPSLYLEFYTRRKDDILVLYMDCDTFVSIKGSGSVFCVLVMVSDRREGNPG